MFVPNDVDSTATERSYRYSASRLLILTTPISWNNKLLKTKPILSIVGYSADCCKQLVGPIEPLLDCGLFI
jgi:hypothetical protein